jgi:hypothetical protein
LRRREALAPPGQFPSVAFIRARGALESIESERRSSLSRLKLYTRELDVERIEKLKNAGILDALIGLQTHRWCPIDIMQETRGILLTSLTTASDEQVRYLVERGCIRVLCEAMDFGTLPAIKRILEVGEARRAEFGRNPYVDQLRAYGCLHRLERLRQDDTGGARDDEINQMITLFFAPPAWLSTSMDVLDTSERRLGRRLLQPILKHLRFLRSKRDEVIDQLLNDTTDRGLGWRLLYPSFKHRHFPRWNREEVVEPLIEDTCPLTIKLFISHRWASTKDPDPDHKNLATVVEFLSRVFMVANGFINTDSFAIKELVIGDGLRSAFHESQLNQCRCGSDGDLGVRSLLSDGVFDDIFYEKVPDILTRRNFYRLLKHVHVWYDYSSLPQGQRTSEEKAFVNRSLRHLADIVAHSEVLALWGLESIDRGWCLLEILAAKEVHFCAPAKRKWTFESRVMFEFANREDPRDLLAYRVRHGPNTLLQVDLHRRALGGLSERQIHKYLRKNRIRCTKAADLALLANLIHRHLQGNHGTTNWNAPPVSS